MLDRAESVSINVKRRWSISRKRRTVFRAIALLLGTALSIASAELGLRAAGWPAPGLYINGRGPIALRAPGKLGGAYPPNVSGRLRHYDYDVEWTVNEDGFRERPKQPKSKSEWRIGVLGDSFAAGFGVDVNKRFSAIWSESLQQHSQAVSVWNLATPNCGTLCEAEILSGVGDSYNLDQVIVAFYGGNDVEDNIEEYRNLALVSTPIPSDYPVRSWIREHSRLATFVWVNALRALSNIRDPGIYSKSELTTLWTATANALGNLKDGTGSRHLTILYLPAVVEWDDGSWRRMQHEFGRKDDERFVVREAIAMWARDNGVEFIDTTPWIRHCSVADCVFPVDGHWTAVAHAIVGRQLALMRIEKGKGP